MGFVVSKDLIAQDPHLKNECTSCHKGNASAKDQKVAHTGLIDRPSDDPVAACGTCHPDIAKNYTLSLHYTAAGMKHGVSGRFSECGKEDLRRQGLRAVLPELPRVLRRLPREEPRHLGRQPRAPERPPVRAQGRDQDLRALPRRPRLPRVHRGLRRNPGRALPQGHDLRGLPPGGPVPRRRYGATRTGPRSRSSPRARTAIPWSTSARTPPRRPTRRTKTASPARPAIRPARIGSAPPATSAREPRPARPSCWGRIRGIPRN